VTDTGLRRVRQRVVLTDVGRVYAADVRAALQQFSGATQKAMALSGGGGLLNLAVLPTLGTRWLIPRLGDFTRRHPQVTVNFAARSEPFDFSQEPFDAAIHFGAPHWAGARCEYLMHERTVPVCSPAFQRAHGRGLTPPEPTARQRTQALDLGMDHALAESRDASLDESRARLRASLQRILAESVELGLAHLSRGIYERYSTLAVEHFGILALDVRHRLTREAVVSVGCLTSSLVHPREVFQEAITCRAAALVLFHNHPSGDPEPSAEDCALTRRLAAAGTLMGIEVLDHLVLGAGRFVSLKQRGVL